VAYWCVGKNGVTSDNMKFVVEKGLIKCKAKPDMCISFVGKKPVKSGDIVLAKCGKKDTVQKINMYDDKTIRFTDALEFGFNVYGGIGDGDKINTRPIKSYPVTAANNEAFLFRTPVPPTPKPTPVPTPSPPLSGLKEAKGWKIVKGDCTIDITSGEPCAVTPNYPKPYKDEDACLVKMTKTKAVKPEVFITEKYFDEVKIGSTKLSGPLKKNPTIALEKGVDTLEWTADFYLGGKGWKICKTKKKAPPLPAVKDKKDKKPEAKAKAKAKAEGKKK